MTPEQQEKCAVIASFFGVDGWKRGQHIPPPDFYTDDGACWRLIKALWARCSVSERKFLVNARRCRSGLIDATYQIAKEKQP